VGRKFRTTSAVSVGGAATVHWEMAGQTMESMGYVCATIILDSPMLISPSICTIFAAWFGEIILFRRTRVIVMTAILKLYVLSTHSDIPIRSHLHFLGCPPLNPGDQC
jgi:hypothetical protein